MLSSLLFKDGNSIVITAVTFSAYFPVTKDADSVNNSDGSDIIRLKIFSIRELPSKVIN